MLLKEFRELTKDLAGELEFCCGGGDVVLVLRDTEVVIIDTDSGVFDGLHGFAVLYDARDEG